MASVTNLTVVHLLAPAAVGGLETVVRLLASGQAGLGHRVCVMAIVDRDSGEHPFLHSLMGTGVEAIPVELGRRAYGEERRLVRRTLEALEPHILHTHGYRPDVLDAPVARKMGVSTVTTVHGFTGGGIVNRSYEWLQRRAFRRFGAVVAVSRMLKEELARVGVPEGRLHLIQNAWAPERPALSRTEAREALGLAGGPVVGWMGRFTQEKGADLLIRAFAELADPSLTLSLVGSGSQETELRDLAAGLGVGERVRWHGLIPGAGRLMGAFDVFVLPSRTEGTPMVLFEAMAAGVPTVCTAVGGIPDVVSERESVLVQNGDLPGLAKGIRSVLDSPDLSMARARRAESRLKEVFSVGTWLDRYEKAYAAARG